MIARHVGHEPHVAPVDPEAAPEDPAACRLQDRDLYLRPPQHVARSLRAGPVTVLDGGLVIGVQPIGVLGLAHLEVCGTASRRPSTSACTGSEMAVWPPITQPWL